MSNYRVNIIALKTKMVEAKLDKIIDLAEVSGISRTTLSNILTGKSYPSTAIMSALMKTLNIQQSEAGAIFFNDNLHNA